MFNGIYGCFEFEVVENVFCFFIFKGFNNVFEYVYGDSVLFNEGYFKIILYKFW